MKPKNTGRQASSALGKALTVLEAIIDHPQSVSPIDLAERLGMSRSSLHRLLNQLHDHGLVVKVPNRDRFVLRARLSKLALNAIKSANQGPPIRAIVQAAVAEIEETVNIGVLMGSNFVYIERVECEREPRIYLETGIHLPAHVTSGGKAMLAFLPNPVRAKVVETMKLVPFTRYTITDRAQLMVELEMFRERGYATAHQEYVEGILGIGVPVLGRDGHPLASVALHAPIQRVDIADAGTYAAKLKETARQLAEVWDMAH